MDSRDAIFLLRGSELMELVETPFATENRFQELLAVNPALLAGAQIDPGQPRRWLLVGREMGIPGAEPGGERWSLDHLFLDQDGIPTLVEVKRAADTRLRREVVGQILDYAANATRYWPVDALRERLEERWRAESTDPAAALRDAFGSEIDPEDYWAQVKTNMQAGRVRLLIVTDQVPAELRRIVEFLNQQMDPAEILALELRHYQGEGLRTVVPRIVGLSADRKGAGGSRGRLDEKSFLEQAAAKLQAPQLGALRKLYQFFANHADEVRFAKTCFSASYRSLGRGPLIYVYSKGRIELNFKPFRAEDRSVPAAVAALAAELNTAFPELKLSEDDFGRYPPIPLEVWQPRVEDLMRVFNQVLPGRPGAAREV
jgi:hypothetical protein